MIFRKKKAQKKKKLSKISAARRITDEYLKRLDFEAFKKQLLFKLSTKITLI